MANNRDGKYGEVETEFGEFIDGEGVVVFRFRDANLPKVMAHYALFCVKSHSPRHHIDLIYDALEKVERWQAENPDLVKNPSSDGYQERTGGS
jgi:hypothetical protein